MSWNNLLNSWILDLDTKEWPCQFFWNVICKYCSRLLLAYINGNPKLKKKRQSQTIDYCTQTKYSTKEEIRSTLHKGKQDERRKNNDKNEEINDDTSYPNKSYKQARSFQVSTRGRPHFLVFVKWLTYRGTERIFITDDAHVMDLT